MQRLVPSLIISSAFVLSACSPGRPPATATAAATSTQAIPAATSTPSAPVVQIDSAADCYDRPEGDQTLVASLPAGQVVPVVGKDDYGKYWVVIEPKSQRGCWISRQGTTPQGLTDYLPNLVPPPTPLPQKPVAPANLKAALESCSLVPGTINKEWSAVVVLTWEDRSDNEDVFVLYKYNARLFTIGRNETQYRDVFKVTGNGSVHASYSLLAFANDIGASERVETEIDFSCK